MTRFRERVKGKRALLAVTEGIYGHCSFAAAVIVRYRIRIRLPYGVENYVVFSKRQRLIGGVFRADCARVGRPTQETVAYALRFRVRYGGRRVSVVRSIVGRGVRAAVCRVYKRKFRAVRHQNATVALDDKGVYAVFFGQSLTVNVNFGAIADNFERGDFVVNVVIAKSDYRVTVACGNEYDVLRRFPYRV